MKKQDVRKLARITIKNGRIDKHVAKFVLRSLGRHDLISYLFFLKQEVAKTSVLVELAQKPSTKTVRIIKKAFKDKNIIFVENKGISEGLIVKEGDTIWDLTVHGFIGNLSEQLKSAYGTEPV